MFKNTDKNELEYMNEVDAALHRRGHPFAFILSVAIIVFFVVFSIWASFAELDEVTRGEGQVIPAQTIQNIQNLEGGILQELRVQLGQKVSKDDVLVVVENDSSASLLQELRIRLADYECAIIRLRAEQAGETPIFPEELSRMYPDIVQNQMSAYELRKQQFDGEKRALEALVQQRRQEVDELSSRISGAEEQLNFNVRRYEQLRPLVDKGIHSRLDLLEVQQRVASAKSEINTLTQSKAKAESAVLESEEKLKNRGAELQSSFQSEISKANTEKEAVSVKMEALERQKGRASIKSPVDGIVQRIMISTQGGTIKGGETIMEILPLDKTLLIEAQIKPQDRAFVFPGQKAIVKITAYDFSIYGGLEATVEQISPSTIEDKRGHVYYEVRLRTDVNYIRYRGQDHDIIPGMTATVDILTGKKTVMAYLLKPITKGASEAMQER